jgi:nucleoside-diphosphate-sugar epimerase
MTEFFDMARKGRIYLFGKGALKTNPIHGEDLAVACVDAIEMQDKEIRIGGPEILTHNEIAETAFTVLGTRPKIAYIPNWVRTSILRLMRFFTGSKTYGPIEFFLTVMAMDMVAPRYGKHTLKEYFKGLKQMHA